MPRGRGSNYLAMAYRVNSKGGLHSAQVLQAMYTSARFNQPLPAGVSVDWQWQNAPQQPWREEDFETVISLPPKGSRAGFIDLMLGRIQRDADRHGVTLIDTELREATPEEVEQIEEELEEAEQAPRREGEGTRRRRIAAKRTEAGKKGAETRRRRAEHKRRSNAAKRGWETRRRNERARARARAKKRKKR